MKKRFIFIIVFFLGLGFTSYGQDGATDSHTVTITVPEVALVDVEPSASNNISLLYTAPTEAGLALTGASNTDLWLNYSSIKSTTNPVRNVSVKIGQVLSGVNLKVSATADAGNGDGTIGISAGELTLTTSDQILISGIGSCYTGDGVNNGHNLNYSVDLTGTYADLQAGSGTAITVTYTITN